MTGKRVEATVRRSVIDKSGLRVGDLITRVGGSSVQVERRELHLPNIPLTTIRSTWKASGGIADFDAVLRPGSTGLIVDDDPMWIVLYDGSAYAPTELARRIDYYIITGGPYE